MSASDTSSRLSIWRLTRRIVLTAIAGIAVAACGGGGGGSSDTNAVSSAGPAAGSTVSNLDASTYMIGLKVVANGRETVQLIGTGFAINDKLLATNAHVVNAILDFSRNASRNGLQIVGVSAFQSETGKEVPLLEALSHPSYTGSTRSPDVGLLVARNALTNALVLASNDEASAMRKADVAQVNGFPGDVSDQIFSNNFQPGLSVPQSSLFTGNIQALRNFDNRVVVDPPTTSTIDMFEYGMDTSPGTSGSAVIRNNKVVAVHNSGVVNMVLRPGPNNTVTIDREVLATASFGIHVKHLHNLIREYNTGVLEADKRFALPVSAALLAATPGRGQSGGFVPTTNNGAANQATFRGSVVNPSNGNVAHQVQFTVNSSLAVAGSSSWPANPALNLAQRSFVLSGAATANGTLEFVDNTPAVIPGFRRGVYTGAINPANGVISGQYYEINETTNELFYFGDWTAAR